MNNELMNIIEAINLVVTKKRKVQLTSDMCDVLWANEGCEDVHCSICLFGYKDNVYTSNIIIIWKRL